MSEVLVKKSNYPYKAINRRLKDISGPNEHDKKTNQRFKEYRNNFRKENYLTIGFKFNPVTEADIISWLDSKENLKEYILGLVDYDLKNRKRK